MLNSADHGPITISDRREGVRKPRQRLTASESLDGLSFYPPSDPGRILPEESFHQMITRERKRSERSCKPLLLMILDAGGLFPGDRTGIVLANILSALALSTRDTDVTGWYKNGSVIGVLFTDLDSDIDNSVLNRIMSRVGDTLKHHIQLRQLGAVNISWHLYPEHCDAERCLGNPTFYPDVVQRQYSQRFVLGIKRLIDILGSSAAILLLSPVFLVVAILVKATSRGPVIFSQQRLGQFGKTFSLLKFRSMHVNNDEKIHQEFITKVIKGEHDGCVKEDGSTPVYKLTRDPRITRFGRFIRRTSLDELPQFFNVLKGDMSLVGPRPPLSYEYKEYDLWHRRRVLEVKPGITGLWQVRGRSRVRFDDMVRLDLEYVRNWSLWLDLRILLLTPKAVIFGGDAF